MEDVTTITKEELMKLRLFHQQHFPGQDIPIIHHNDDFQESVTQQCDESDLGFYEDGTRRTLTNEQIAMFRHSEIQRLLAERRRQREQVEQQKTKADKEKSRKLTRPSTESTIARFEKDEALHARAQTLELSYDDTTAPENSGNPKTFQWPKLG